MVIAQIGATHVRPEGSSTYNGVDTGTFLVRAIEHDVTLVADTVRGLCSGKGFLFADRGDFVAKGFEEPVRIYEVNWRS